MIKNNLYKKKRYFKEYISLNNASNSNNLMSELSEKLNKILDAKPEDDPEIIANFEKLEKIAEWIKNSRKKTQFSENWEKLFQGIKE